MTNTLLDTLAKTLEMVRTVAENHTVTETEVKKVRAIADGI